MRREFFHQAAQLALLSVVKTGEDGADLGRMAFKDTLHEPPACRRELGLLAPLVVM